MEQYGLLALAAVVIVVIATAFANRLRVAAPILLVLIGIGCSYIPGAPRLEIDPEWILMVVLPPLLYSAAVNLPAIDLRRNFGPIAALSVLLVIVSAFVSGTIIWALFPELDYAAAIAVGAVISPTDAVAATAVGRRLGLPPRLLSILEGEGLLNDATALVLLRSSIAAIAGAISFWGAIADFAFAVVGGVAVGGLIGAITVWVRGRIRQPVLTTALSFVVPFLAYLPAEQIGASGVLAVVVAGLVTGHFGLRRFSAQERIAERMNWRTIQLLLENGVFLVMGFEILSIVGDVQSAQLGVAAAVGIGLLSAAVLLAVRVAFIVPLVGLLRLGRRRAVRRADRIRGTLDRVAAADIPEHRAARVERVTVFLRRQHADASFIANEGLGWRGGAVLAWAGMRGVVTLAAAQSLPFDVPYRSQLVLVAFTVAITTLLLQGGTLPWLIRLLRIRGTPAEETHAQLTALTAQIGAAGRAILDDPGLRREDGRAFDPEVVDHIRAADAAAVASLGSYEEWVADETPLQQRRELQRRLIDAEQAALADARASGEYASHVIEEAQRLIDAESARLGGPEVH